MSIDLQQFLKEKDKELRLKKEKAMVLDTPIQEMPIPNKGNSLNDRINHAVNERDFILKRERQMAIEKQIAARNKEREAMLKSKPKKLTYDKKHELTPEQSKQMLQRIKKMQVIEKEDKFINDRLKPHTHLALVSSKTEVIQGNPAPENAFYGKQSSFDKIAIIGEQGEMIGSPTPIQQVADLYGQKSIMEAMNNGDLDMSSSMVPESYYYITDDGDEKSEYALGGVFDIRPDKEESLILTVAALAHGAEGIEQHSFSQDISGNIKEEHEPALVAHVIEQTEFEVTRQTREISEDTGEILHEFGETSSWTE